MPKVSKKSSLKSSSKKNRSLKKKNIRKNKVKKNISRGKKSKNKNTKSKKRVMRGGSLQPTIHKPVKTVEPLSKYQIVQELNNQELINAIDQLNLKKVQQLLEGKSKEYINLVLDYIGHLESEYSKSIAIIESSIENNEQLEQSELNEEKKQLYNKILKNLNERLREKGIEYTNLLSIEKSIRGKLERSF